MPLYGVRVPVPLQRELSPAGLQCCRAVAEHLPGADLHRLLRSVISGLTNTAVVQPSLTWAGLEWLVVSWTESRVARLQASTTARVRPV